MNLNSKLTDLDGNEFADGSTVKSVSLIALLSTLPGDEKIEGPEKLSIFDLQKKIHAAGDDASLTAEEITLLKKRVIAGYNPLVVGRVFEVIDPAALV